MSSLDACENYREMIVALTLRELDAPAVNEIDRHIQRCEKCQRYHAELVQAESTVRTRFDTIEARLGSVESAILGRLTQETLSPLGQSRSLMRHVGRRLRTMSRRTRIAACFLIVLGMGAIIAWLSGGNGSVAFADVVRPLLYSRTVVFNVTASDRGQTTIRVMSMGTQRIRYEMSTAKMVNAILIYDLDKSRLLTLDPETKMAVSLDLENVDDPPENYLATIRNIITSVEDDPGSTVETLGEQHIDGQLAVAFCATGPQTTLTIWADPETLQPVRVEYTSATTRFTCTDFDFDVEMDESLFSMEVPEGYTVQKGQLDLTGNTEEDLIGMLRVWAQMMGGVFPHTIDPTDPKNLSSWAKRKAELRLSKEQHVERVFMVARGNLFIHSLKPECDWHYAGEGVKLGDSTKAIFWYRPQGSEFYRVIHGDLSVKEITAAERAATSREAPAE